MLFRSGRQNELGTIEPGKLADLVFVSRDPLQDVGNLRSVEFTVKRGVIYRRSDYQPFTPGAGRKMPGESSQRSPAR